MMVFFSKHFFIFFPNKAVCPTVDRFALVSAAFQARLGDGSAGVRGQLLA